MTAQSPGRPPSQFATLLSRLTKPMLGRRIAIALLVLTFSISAGRPGPAEKSSAALDKTALEAIDAAAKRNLQAGSVGVAIAVMHNGRIIFTKGYGRANIEDDVPVTPETVFRIGSLTKQFTAASVMVLAQEGKLSVDDKLSKFFSEFPRGGEITLRHLLNHTSGIHDFTDTPEFHQHIERYRQTTANLVDAIEKQSPVFDFEPGTNIQYTNSGYVLLGAIVEKLSGQSLRDFFKQNLFGKSGMADTSVDDNADVVPHRAAGYQRPFEHPELLNNAEFISMTVPGGAGNLRSTVGDLVRWHDALTNGRIIRPELFQEMTKPGRLNNGKITDMGGGSYGYGLLMDQFEGHPRIRHGGGIYGFTSQLDTLPDQRISIAVLFNTNATEGSFKDEVLKIVLASLVANRGN
jgi:D-alanyl-D-alanine carboxypeptidase